MLCLRSLNRCPVNLKERTRFRTATDSPNTVQESVNINPNQSSGHVSICVLPRLHWHLLGRGLPLQQTSAPYKHLHMIELACLENSHARSGRLQLGCSLDASSDT